ncbi:MAG: 10 kDa chaperonin [bacterium]|nr:10 kDa chaperonin [bacterium]
MATATATKPAAKKAASASPIRPLGDRVVVKPVEEFVEKTAGGLYLPESAQEKPQLAEVVAVGPGKRNDDGSLSPIDLAIGARIFHSRYGGTTVKVNGQEYIIVREDDILAVYEG